MDKAFFNTPVKCDGHV